MNNETKEIEVSVKIQVPIGYEFDRYDCPRYLEEYLDMTNGGLLTAQTDHFKCGGSKQFVLKKKLSSLVQWKPEYGDDYWYIDEESVYEEIWNDNCIDIERLRTNNVFRTQEEAQASTKAKVMQSEYVYYSEALDSPKLEVVPKGLELYNGHSWDASKAKYLNDMFGDLTYRYKPSEQ